LVGYDPAKEGVSVFRVAEVFLPEWAGVPGHGGVDWNGVRVVDVGFNNLQLLGMSWIACGI